MPTGMPAHVIEALSGYKRVFTRWNTDPIIRQHCYIPLQETKGRYSAQPDAAYPDMAKLARSWGKSVAECEPLMPDNLAMVHFRHWGIAPTNFLQIAVGPDFKYPSGPNTPEGGQIEGTVSRVISDPRLRYFPELALKLATAIESGSWRDVKDIPSQIAPKRQVQLGKFKQTCPALTREGDQRIALSKTDPQVDGPFLM